MKIVWLLSALALLGCDAMPIMDLTSGSPENDNELHYLKIEGPSHKFQVKLDTNPSTGYHWHEVKNPRTNCLCKIRKIDTEYASQSGFHLVGQPTQVTITYEALF